MKRTLIKDNYLIALIPESPLKINQSHSGVKKVNNKIITKAKIGSNSHSEAQFLYRQYIRRSTNQRERE